MVHPTAANQLLYLRTRVLVEIERAPLGAAVLSLLMNVWRCGGCGGAKMVWGKLIGVIENPPQWSKRKAAGDVSLTEWVLSRGRRCGALASYHKGALTIAEAK